MLDQAGGLGAFAQYIAEDYFMAKAIADRYAHTTHTYEQGRQTGGVSWTGLGGPKAEGDP